MNIGLIGAFVALQNMRNNLREAEQSRRVRNVDYKPTPIFDEPEMVVCPHCGEVQENDPDELEVCINCDEDFN